jgi:subtilisin family serine protease
MPRLLTAVTTVSSLVLVGLVTAGPAVAETAPRATSPAASAETSEPGRYIVQVAEGVEADDLSGARMAPIETLQEYTYALNGFAAELDAAQLAQLSASSRVESIVPDQIVSADAERTSPPWGLDRIDQRPRAGDGVYRYSTTGAGVTAFIIDSGIRTTHKEFGGRAVSGYDFVNLDGDAEDCLGHGTHVAGTVGGATMGVASDVKLVALKVFGCDRQGWSSDMIAAMDWTIAHKPAGASVINMSLGGAFNSPFVDAVARVTAAGIPVVVSAGNETTDACTRTPAAAPSAITVAATSQDDSRASFSNYGPCVDVFAPGEGVLSAYPTSDTATTYMSGTSMAAPHVTGVVARLLQQQPTASPAAIDTLLAADATRDAVTDPLGSVNRLLYATGAAAITGVAPVISGSATVGSTLTAVPGDWQPSPVAFAYKWYSNGVPVDGQAASTYVVRSADVGKKITLTVTGSRSGYASLSRSSQATVTVPVPAANPLPLTATPSPSISGQVAVGSTVTAVTGAWAPAPVAFAYRWFSGGVSIAGATLSTYRVTAEDVGKKITVTVTGSKVGYASVSRSSPATVTVPVATVTRPLTSTPTPTILGTPTVGQKLTARTGTWQPSPVALSYQWNRDGAAIAGATAATYLVAAADAGTQLSLSVTGSKAGYTAVSRTSAPLAKVVSKVIIGTAPTITGSGVVGQKLTAVPGAWSPAPVAFKYVWMRDGVAIARATTSAYTPTSADSGKTLTVSVTGTKAGYAPSTRTSAGKLIR